MRYLYYSSRPSSLAFAHCPHSNGGHSRKSPARRMFPLSWGCIQNREPLSARGLEGGPSLPPFLIHRKTTKARCTQPASARTKVFPVLRNRAAASSLRNITSSSRLPQCSPSFSAALPGRFSFSPLRYCRPRCNAALPGCCSFSPLRYCRPRCNAALPGCRRRPDRRPRASGWICGLSSSCILMMCS